MLIGGRCASERKACLISRSSRRNVRGFPAEIRKVYEVDPLICPKCLGQMRIIAFITDYAVVDRIINHLKLTFVAERPPPPHLVY